MNDMKHYVVFGQTAEYMAELCVGAANMAEALSIWNCYFGDMWTDIKVLTSRSSLWVDRSIRVTELIGP